MNFRTLNLIKLIPIMSLKISVVLQFSKFLNKSIVRQIMYLKMLRTKIKKKKLMQFYLFYKNLSTILNQGKRFN